MIDQNKRLKELKKELEIMQDLHAVKRTSYRIHKIKIFKQWIAEIEDPNKPNPKAYGDWD